MAKKWTESEDQIIRAHWLSDGFIRDFAHLLPGRTFQAVEKRGFMLKLGARKAWTPEQDAHLVKIWSGNERIKSHAHMFPGHSIAAIYTRASSLGLGRRPSHGGFSDTYAWSVILKELTKGPAIASDLADATKFDQSVIYRYLKQRHTRGEIHIASWTRKTQSGKPVPVYMAGKGVDAAKPERLSAAEKERRRRKAKLHRRIASGDVVKSVNVFAVALGSVTAPRGTRGRIIKQDTAIHLHDDEEVAA